MPHERQPKDHIPEDARANIQRLTDALEDESLQWGTPLGRKVWAALGVEIAYASMRTAWRKGREEAAYNGLRRAHTALAQWRDAVKACGADWSSLADDDEEC